MSDPTGTVYIIDDDPSLRRAVARLCRSVGLTPRTLASARDFLEAGVTECPACLVLDVRLPGLSGLDLQAELAARNIRTPVVFITGHGDIPTSVQAMKAGAVDFLTKPFTDQNLITVVQEALRRDARRQTAMLEHQAIHRRIDTLTPRERQVFEKVIQGLLNKQIAAELGASVQTIKIHRRRVMVKMQVTSVAELVQAAVRAGILKA